MGDRFLNHLCSSARVIGENVLAGVKRCRIVNDVLRHSILWRLETSAFVGLSAAPMR